MTKNINIRRRSVQIVSAFAAVAVISSPAAVGAATTDTIISSSIDSVISLLTSSGTVNINVTPTGAGAQTIASDTVTVSTNNTAGYVLQLAEATTDTALISGADTIPASAGTQAAPEVMAVNTWGYRVDGVGGFGVGVTNSAASTAIGAATFAAVPTTGSPDTLKTTATSAANDTTVVWYGVAADTTQNDGTYTNTVTYTATPN